MFEPIRRWPRFVKALIVCVFAAALGTLIAAKVKPNTDAVLAAAADRYQLCFEAQDSKCLFQFASSSERKSLGLTEESFSKFADTVIWPKFKGMTPEGKPNRMTLDSDVRLVATKGGRALYAESAALASRRIAVIQRYKNAAGKVDTFEFELTNTPSGPRSASLVGTLYLTSVSAFVPKSQVRQWRRYRYWSKQTKFNLINLQNSGVKGYVANAFNEAANPVSWAQWIDYWDTDFKHREALKPMMSDKLPGGMTAH